jgi:cytochrome c oxidase subunit 2
MRATAVVDDQAAYDEWLAAAANPAPPPAAGGGAADGKALFTNNGCGACHTLSDAGANGTAGPNLDEALADKDEAFIKTSIENPSAEVADGYSDSMPKTYGSQLGAQNLDALVKYLSEVTKGG